MKIKTWQDFVKELNENFGEEHDWTRDRLPFSEDY